MSKLFKKIILSLMLVFTIAITSEVNAMDFPDYSSEIQSEDTSSLDSYYVLEAFWDI